MEGQITIDCSEPWYGLIQTKIKPVEGRKGTLTWSAIKKGDIVIFRDPDDHLKTFKAEVTGINKYTGKDALDQYLISETLERALPGVSSVEEGRKIYLQWSTLEQIEKYGMLGIQIRPI